MGEIIAAIVSGMSHPVFSILVIAIVIFAAFLVMTGRLRKTSSGFELGDNTKFEKTNQRFKQLCVDTKAISATIPSMILTIEKINSRLTEVELSTMRIEIVSMIEQHPEERLLICRMYDEYKKSGGNTYIDSLFDNWKRSFNKELP
jgi:type III secretory pathway component EscV